MNERVLVIFYNHRWGGAFADKKWWTAVFEGEVEVWDYGTRAQLEMQAEKEGLKFKTLRHHMDGTTSVLKTNIQ